MFDTVRHGPVLTKDAVCTEDAFDEVVPNARALFDGHRDIIFGCLRKMAEEECLLGARQIETSAKSVMKQWDRQRFDPLTYTMIDRDQDTIALPVRLYSAVSCESYDSGSTIDDRWTSCL
jgi:hypothetical protein